MRHKAVYLLLAVVALTAQAGARVELAVDIGWDGIYRPGCWTPLFITVADTSAVTARQAVLELRSPYDALSRLRVVQPLTLEARSTTYRLYLPLSYDLDATSATLRSASGATLARRNLSESTGTGTRPPWNANPNEIFIGTSGPAPVLRMLGGPFAWDPQSEPQQAGQPEIHVGYLPPRRLPDEIVGYDGLDLLVLSGVDLTTMELRQQQAIADWVRGGGRLLLWPGDGLIPEHSPIVSLAPCRIGGIGELDLALTGLKNIYIPTRSGRVLSRALDPLPASQTRSLLPDGWDLCYSRAGLGIVGVLSFDPASLSFQQRKDALSFWRPVLRDLLRPDQAKFDERNPFGYGDARDALRAAAMELVIQRLGDVPGMGRIDFGYVALVMIGLMLIVGPLDWFVLKWLGRQPWTWATVLGWMGLITAGALYLGHVMRSGELHYRTVRLIDQVEQRTVGAIDVVAIYSPRTQRYAMEGPPDDWFAPARTQPLYYSGGGSHAPAEVPLAQGTRGQRPLPMTIPIWSMRFLEASHGDPAAHAPMLAARLRQQWDSKGPRLVGSISNLSAWPLVNVTVRTRAGQGLVTVLRDTSSDQDPAAPPGRIARIEPGATIEVSVPIPEDGATPRRPNEPIDGRGYYGYGAAQVYGMRPDPQLNFQRAVGDLAIRRSQRINDLLAEDATLVCVTAEAVVSEPAVRLTMGASADAIERHWRVVRAVFSLQQEPQP